MARNRADLGALMQDARWSRSSPSPSTPLWTDDFSNILSVLDLADPSTLVSLRSGQAAVCYPSEVDAARCDLLLTNAIVLTMDAQFTVHRGGAVAITGDSIAAVGPDALTLPRSRHHRLRRPCRDAGAGQRAHARRR